PASHGLDRRRDPHPLDGSCPSSLLGPSPWSLAPVTLSQDMKDIYISDLSSYEEGKLFDGYFLVLSRQQRTTQSNKPYLNFMFCDKTGQLEGRAWEPSDPRISKAIDRGDVVKARGCITRFNDRLQMKVEQLRRAQPGEFEKSD